MNSHLSGKKIHPYISRTLQIPFPHIFFIYIFFDKWLFTMLLKAYVVLWAANHFVGSETPKHNSFDFIDENFKNLNSISNVFHETHYFLFLTDSVVICTYLRRTSVRSFWKKPPADIFLTRGTSIITLKWDLVRLLNTFWNPFCRESMVLEVSHCYFC